MPEDRPQRKPIAPSPCADEAAAIVVAIERFTSATAPPQSPLADAPDPWRRAAIVEGVSREHRDDAPHPWINT